MTNLTKALMTTALLVLAQAGVAWSNIYLPSIFGDHMVLQRDQKNPVWGWGEPGEKVTVTLGDQKHSTTVGADGSWRVELEPLPAGGPHVLVVKGKNTVDFEDVLVGEVWVCSGQSNMQWPVSASNDADLESMTARLPNLRLVTVPQIGTQHPQRDFSGAWAACTPETVREFSAVGYFFGRILQQALDVPVGLIDNAWGGSAAEAWVPNEVLGAHERYTPLLDRWKQQEANEENAKPMAEFEAALERWNEENALAKASGQQPPQPPQVLWRNPLATQGRPANLYNGQLHPILGYGIRGVIWYQGESNAGRAYQYRHLFPLMIEQWRKAWGQGDFSFYWVQLADFKQEKAEPAESDWAELREAQTMTLSQLPKTGEAVIIDIGEGRDIHPRNKQDVGKRLARWALAKDYAMALPYRSPTYQGMEKQENKVLLTFDHVGRGLYAFDTQEPVGFAIAGADKKFVWAKAKIVGENKVEVWSEEVPDPVAVRYAWADNPVCNLYSREGLPATPFRTDDWPGVTADRN